MLGPAIPFERAALFKRALSNRLIEWRQRYIANELGYLLFQTVDTSWLEIPVTGEWGLTRKIVKHRCTQFFNQCDLLRLGLKRRGHVKEFARSKSIKIKYFFQLNYPRTHDLQQNVPFCYLSHPSATLHMSKWDESFFQQKYNHRDKTWNTIWPCVECECRLV